MTFRKLVVKEEILQFSPLNGHDDGAVGACNRRQDPLGPFLKRQRPGGAVSDTDPAAEALIHIQPHHLLLGPLRIIGRYEGKGFDGAGGDTASASGTEVESDFGEEIGRMHGVQVAETAGGGHGFAAAAAAMADKADALAGVVAELNEVMAVGLIEQIDRFGGVDGAGVLMADKGIGAMIEGHADFHRRRTGGAPVHGDMAAITKADADVGSGTDNRRGPFVIHDPEGERFGKGGFLHKGAAHLGFPGAEEIFDEIFLHHEVLVVKIGEQLLIDVAGYPHHRKFEKSHHRRWKAIGDGAGFIDEIE